MTQPQRPTSGGCSRLPDFLQSGHPKHWHFVHPSLYGSATGSSTRCAIPSTASSLLQDAIRELQALAKMATCLAFRHTTKTRQPRCGVARGIHMESGGSVDCRGDQIKRACPRGVTPFPLPFPSGVPLEFWRGRC